MAFDLDGTILEPGEVIAEDCVAAIRRLRRLGILCVINSGRSAAFQAELLARLGLLECFAALIGDERWVQLVDGDDHRLQPLQPWNDETERRWQQLEPEAERLCAEAEAEADELGWQTRVYDRSESVRRGLWALGLETADQSLAMYRRLEPRMPEGLAVNCNGSYIHIYDRDRDKGTSLAAVAEHFGVSADRVLAFGDNVNDRPMLDGRHGFASGTPANASAEVQGWVRAAGGLIAERPRGLGVADLLDQVIPQSVG